jgi:hypothetical protein
VRYVPAGLLWVLIVRPAVGLEFDAGADEYGDAEALVFELLLLPQAATTSAVATTVRATPVGLRIAVLIFVIVWTPFE